MGFEINNASVVLSNVSASDHGRGAVSSSKVSVNDLRSVASSKVSVGDLLRGDSNETSNKKIGDAVENNNEVA